MKKISLFIFLLINFQCYLEAQNVGIGTKIPLSALHIANTNSSLLILENKNAITVDSATAIYFANNLQGTNTNKYAGAIKMIGTSNDLSARMGFFTFASATVGGLLESFTISDIGRVGINNTNPQALLDVNGNVRFRTDAAIDGNLTITGNVQNNLNVSGDITVANGKGVVRSNTNKTQKIVRLDAPLHLTNFTAGNYAYATLAYETFGDIPTVVLGAVSGGNGQWYEVVITPVNVTNSSCQLLIYNPTNHAVTFTPVTWQVLIIGAQ